MFSQSIVNTEEKTKAKRRLNQSMEEEAMKVPIERRNEFQLGKSRRWRSSCGRQELMNQIIKTDRLKKKEKEPQSKGKV